MQAVNARAKIGRTPLPIATGSHGSVDSVRLLPAKGADSKAADFRAATSGATAALAEAAEPPHK